MNGYEFMISLGANMGRGGYGGMKLLRLGLKVMRYNVGVNIRTSFLRVLKDTDWSRAVNVENIHTNTIHLSPQKAVDAWMANASESTKLLNTDADNQSTTTGSSRVSKSPASEQEHYN